MTLVSINLILKRKYTTNNLKSDSNDSKSNWLLMAMHTTVQTLKIMTV